MAVGVRVGVFVAASVGMSVNVDVGTGVSVGIIVAASLGGRGVEVRISPCGIVQETRKKLRRRISFFGISCI